MDSSLDNWADISTIVAALIAVCALVYTAVQVRISTRVSRAEFWLELRKMFADHQEIHLKLRGNQWSNDDNDPPTDDEWAKLEAYMGLFEHCELMLRQGLIDWSTFRMIYGYRLDSILQNPTIVREKLIIRRHGWEAFVRLTKRLDSRVLHTAYLCGYWDSNHGEWRLWWGTPDNCFEVIRFSREQWPALEAQYYNRFRQLQGSRKVCFAWLHRDGQDLHVWPEMKRKQAHHETIENRVASAQIDSDHP